ncbi:MAG: hypothetical protein KBT11_10340 [Treponema sp.]|nr:hypothetical protein [Candidatus Treponema equifaecale]
MNKLIRRTVVSAVLMTAGIFAYGQEASASNDNFNGAKEYFHFGLNKNTTFFNGNSDTKIISLGVLTASDKSIVGCQSSVFFNHVDDEAVGLQYTAGVSIAENGFTGGQISGITNISHGLSRGAQISHGANIAEKLSGTQISFLFNKAKTVKGLQLGLVNISDDTDSTLGLVNIIKNGVHDFGISYDSNGKLCLQIQEGGKNLFTNIGVAGKVQGDFFNGEFCEVWLGLGSRFAYKKLSLDTEFLWKYVFSKEFTDLRNSVMDAHDADNDELAEELVKDFSKFQIPHLQFSLNFEVAKHFALFGAFGVDLRVEDFNDEAFNHQKHNLSGSFNAGDKKISLYPAFSAGIKIK